jgi:K+ transporter
MPFLHIPNSGALMKIAAILGALTIVGALVLPPNTTVESCAQGLRHAKETHTLGVVHECDGLTQSQQEEAVRLAS